MIDYPLGFLVGLLVGEAVVGLTEGAEVDEGDFVVGLREGAEVEEGDFVGDLVVGAEVVQEGEDGSLVGDLDGAGVVPVEEVGSLDGV